MATHKINGEAPQGVDLMVSSHNFEIQVAVEQVLTRVVKLQVTESQRDILADTAKAFASACNWINTTVNPKLTNRNSIQAVCYHEVKKQFGLSANHVVRAGARVAANRLSAKQKGKKVKGFKPTSFDCDGRTFSFREQDWTISVSTTGKLQRRVVYDWVV